ncbi:MAG: DUF4070 domain-containing protein [bacterium]|nr:DUF4070 domain-containing protein [bacterium]
MAPLKSKRYGPGNRFRKIYLVAPRHPENIWAMQVTVDLFGAKTLMPNAALATLMALTPPGVSVEYVLGDENLSPVDFDLPCDLVAVTGSTLHARRIREICGEFRRRKIPVALGGTYASLYRDELRDLADYLFIGEAEETWPEFLRQWQNGNATSTYVAQSHPDLSISPAPDWSLINARDYLYLTVQTSRGCPNRCDFCDVIQYFGRVYRTKAIPQILEEVKTAHRLGAQTVFFSDDNFLGNRSFTKELLPELIRWNTAQAYPLSFSAQVTVQAGDDPELLKMLADAKFSVLFLGVETSRKESLEEIHKTHNLQHDLRQRLRAISSYGMVPFLGMIVGFDHDDLTIFDELNQFIDDTYAPIVCLSLLNAPKNTELYNRLQRENRLVADDFSGEWQFFSNIIPKQMTREELQQQYVKLFRKIYEPERFGLRLERWLSNVTYQSALYVNKKFSLRQFARGLQIIRFFLFRTEAPLRRLLWRSLAFTWKFDRRLLRRTFSVIAQYPHFYYFVAAMKK